MSHYLFEAHPSLAEHIPAIPLVDQPTPIRKLADKMDEDTPDRIWVKRDDLTHPVYGGNKVRKLGFILAEALAKQKKQIVTFGAIGTNHGLATTLHAQAQGLQTKLFLFDQPVTQTVKQNLLCMQSLGAELHYRKSLLRTALAFYWSQFFAKKTEYHLFAGGSNIAGCYGFIDAAFELRLQVEQGLMPEPDVIICPVGSGATLAGLTLGLKWAGLQSRVLGVRVAPSHLGPIPTCTTKTVSKLMHQTYQQICQFYPALKNLQLPNVHMSDLFYGGGYGVATNEGKRARERFEQHGIPLEDTYTAKAAAACLSHARQFGDQRILYWHTFNSMPIQPLIKDEAASQLPNNLKAILSEED